MLDSIRSEFERYRALLQLALEQVHDDEFERTTIDDGNSIAVVVQHLAGNLASRFTDFLDTDGEKPWRGRDSEFEPAKAERVQLMERMEESWSILHRAIDDVESREALDAIVTIRGVELTATAALHRSLSHFTYHVGQVVLLARSFRGGEWKSLSIPRGGSAEYARDPSREVHPSGSSLDTDTTLSVADQRDSLD